MTPLDAITKMLETSGMTKYALAGHLGRSSNSVYNMFRGSNNVRMNTMLGTCEATGFRMVLINDDGVEIVVELPQKED